MIFLREIIAAAKQKILNAFLLKQTKLPQFLGLNQAHQATDFIKSHQNWAKSPQNQSIKQKQKTIKSISNDKNVNKFFDNIIKNKDNMKLSY